MIKSQGSLLSLACAAGAVAAVMFGGAVPTVFAAAMLTPLGFLGAGNDAAPSRFHTRWPTVGLASPPPSSLEPASLLYLTPFALLMSRRLISRDRQRCRLNRTA